MLTNFFGKSYSINFIVLFAFILLYALISFLGFPSESKLTLGYIMECAGLFGLVLLYCFIIGFILSKNKLAINNSYIFFVFVAFFGFFPEVFRDPDTLLFNILLLVFLYKIVSLRNPAFFYKKLFDCGLWLAVLFIFNTFSLAFGFLIFLLVYISQKLDYRTVLIPVLGFSAPLFILFAYYFWGDKLEDFYSFFNWNFSYDYEIYFLGPYAKPIWIVSFFSVIAFLFKAPKAFFVSGNYRKYWIAVIFTLVLSIAYVLLKNPKNGSELLIVFFPTSMMIGNWIGSVSNKIIKEIIH